MCMCVAFGGRVPCDPGRSRCRRKLPRRLELLLLFSRCGFFFLFSLLPSPPSCPALETVAADEGAGGRPPGAPASPPLPPPRQDGSEMSPEPKPPPPSPSLPPPPPPTPGGREAEVVALTVAAAAAVESEAAASGASSGGGRKCGSRIMLVRRIGFKPGGGASVSVCEETPSLPPFPSRGFRPQKLRGSLAVIGRGCSSC